MPDSTQQGWDGPDESIAQLMRHSVLTREMWVALVRDIERRRLGERIVDALCGPPACFMLGVRDRLGRPH